MATALASVTPRSACPRPGRAVWPACVLGTLAALATGFALGLGTAGIGIVSLGLILALLWLERRMPADPDQRFGDDPQRWNDIGHTLVGSLTGEVVGNLVVVATAAALAAQLPPVLQLWPADAPLWAQIALLVVAADFLEYWRHRAEHRIPWLWRVHALHHDAERLHVMKSSRNHALDLLTRFLVVFAPLALVGAPPALLPLYSAAIMVFGPVSHANLELPVAHWLHRVVVTPQVHALHHALERRHSDSNFAPVTPLWDQLFGTFSCPERGAMRPLRFGIDGERWPRAFGAQLLAPFRGPESS